MDDDSDRQVAEWIAKKEATARIMRRVYVTVGVILAFLLGKGSVDTSTSDECIVALNIATQVMSAQTEIISFYENKGDNDVTLRGLISDLRLTEDRYSAADNTCRHKT
jgi:hypothetical protein